MCLIESFQRPPRAVPSDNRDHISSKAFVDWMPLDIDALVKASHLKNSGHARDAPIQRNNDNGCGEGKKV